MKSSTFIVLGYASRDVQARTRRHMADLVARLAERCGLDLAVTPLPTYDDLTQRLHRGEIDLAWLPPIPLVALMRSESAIPLVSLHRDSLVHFRCALIVPTTSDVAVIEGLRGKSPAWVDRHSAAGYVLARIQLATHGIGEHDLGAERFVGTHDAVVRAVASGRADFGSTFARITREGEVTGAWSQAPGLARSIKVLTTFADIPPDAIAARSDMAPDVRARIKRAFFDIATGERDLLSQALGADSVYDAEPAMYESLRNTVFDAYKTGVLASDTVPELPSAEATIEVRPGSKR